MDLASRVLTYALIPLAIGLTFRWLAKRFPVSQSTTELSPQTRPARPKGHTAYALSVVLGGTAVAIAASYALAALGQRLAERGDCTVACFGGSFLIWLVPWLFAGFVIVGLAGEALVRQAAPHLLESWRQYDQERTGVDWRRLERPMYVAVAALTLVVTLLGLHYSVRFGAAETEVHRFLVPGVLRLAHSDLDSIIAYDCVRLRDGSCKPQPGILLAWRSGERLSSGGNLYNWRPADARRLARKLAEHTGASVRLGGAMPRRDQ